MTEKEILGLKLLLVDHTRDIRKQNQFKHNCYIDTRYEHDLHTQDNLQSNSIVDLMISQGIFLDEKLKLFELKLERLAQQITNIETTLRHMLQQDTVGLQDLKTIKRGLNIHG